MPISLIPWQFFKNALQQQNSQSVQTWLVGWAYAPMLHIWRSLLALTIFVSSAHAYPIMNPGFESGDFTGWSTIGDTLVVNSSFGVTPPRGTYQALITNGPGFLPFGKFTGSYSGNDSVDATSIVYNPLDPFLGLSLGSVTQFSQAIGYSVGFEGSAVKQSFTANKGSILSFKWNYLTDETGPIDFAFIVLDGNLSLLADSSTTHPAAGTLFGYGSGYHTFATTLASSGVHQLAIGVIDTGDPAVNSGVLLDDFTLRALPVPGTLLLLISGLACLCTLHRTRKTNTALPPHPVAARRVLTNQWR